jgi:Glucodextranase, domain B
MNKDALLATAIGFGIGLLITAILLVGPSAAKFLPNVKLPAFSWLKQQPKNTPEATPTPTQFTVTIDSPLDETIEAKEVVLVSGVTAPKSMVIIQGIEDEAVVRVGDDGKYAGRITLFEGKNDVSVTSYLGQEQAQKTTTVYYTPETL